MTEDQINQAAVLYVATHGSYPHLNATIARKAAEALIRAELERDRIREAMRAVVAS